MKAVEIIKQAKLIGNSSNVLKGWTVHCSDTAVTVYTLKLEWLEVNTYRYGMRRNLNK